MLLLTTTCSSDKESFGFLHFLVPATLLQGLDFVVAEARRHGIYLLLCLTNNFPDFGGKGQYVRWARDAGHNLTTADDFFNSTVVKDYYKNHVKVRDRWLSPCIFTVSRCMSATSISVVSISSMPMHLARSRNRSKRRLCLCLFCWHALLPCRRC